MNRILTLALALSLLPGCRKSARSSLPEQDAALIGVWLDDVRMKTTIASDGQRARVSHIVDSDGEIFPVVSSGWTPDGFVYVYDVPSTGYVVTITVHTVEEDTMAFDWSNRTPDGGQNQGSGTAERLE